MIVEAAFHPEVALVGPGDDQYLRHYSSVEEVPHDIRKYWQQRYTIFSRYDEGIQMTRDSWYGVTPEPVASKVAQHASTAADPQKRYLIDCFAGVGGNAIAFAQSERWDHIYAIEKDSASIECGRRNAEIYGVDPYITWIHGDCFDILTGTLREIAMQSVIFASPPWGGPTYKSESIFDLHTMQPYSLASLISLLLPLTTDFLLYLPRTSDLRQVAAAYKGVAKIEVIHYCVEGASKALCAYFGSFMIP